MNLLKRSLDIFFDKDCGLKLNSGVNFIKVLQAAFTHEDPESALKTVRLSVFFGLSGSARVKSACSTLMKLTPENNNNQEVFQNLKRTKVLSSLGSNLINLF